jgi:hypothetical protein
VSSATSTTPRTEAGPQADPQLRQRALRFIVALGLVSLFADVVYEGGRAILGPFLATLGASAATVGLIAGTGEFVGYGLRVVAGYVSDRTGRYWSLTFVGYGLTVDRCLTGAPTGAPGHVGVDFVTRRIGRKPLA